MIYFVEILYIIPTHLMIFECYCIWYYFFNFIFWAFCWFLEIQLIFIY